MVDHQWELLSLPRNLPIRLDGLDQEGHAFGSSYEMRFGVSIPPNYQIQALPQIAINCLKITGLSLLRHEALLIPASDYHRSLSSSSSGTGVSTTACCIPLTYQRGCIYGPIAAKSDCTNFLQRWVSAWCNVNRVIRTWIWS